MYQKGGEHQMAKNKKPHRLRIRRPKAQKSLTSLEIIYMTVGILAGIANIVCVIYQIVKGL